MDKQIIPIVFATDENYVPYCGVAVSSLIKHAGHVNTYEITILFDSLSSLSVYRLEHLSTDHVRVSCRSIHAYIAGLKVLEYNHLTIASAYRLVIPDVLSQYDKVLYLDSDIVVNEDVAKLYHMDIGSNLLGAVRGYFKRDKDDFIYNHITKTLGISEDSFFNAGILIMNIVGFKEKDVAHRCFKLLTERDDLYFMDQCALNIVCEGSVHYLPGRWNHEWLYLFAANNDRLPTSCEEFERCKAPAIIHYDGVEKPWDYPEQFLSDFFWSYARDTIFYEEILYASQVRRTRELVGLLGAGGACRNIAVYGAGNAGRRYVKRILSLKLCRIVLWVDRNYSEKKGYELPVECVEKLYSAEFDQVFIVIENATVSNQVKEMLISNHIPSSKIVQIYRV